MVLGVAGGLGEYFDVDPTLFRLAFVVLSFAGGLGLIAYVVAALLMPSPGAPQNWFERTFTNGAGSLSTGGVVVLAIGIAVLASAVVSELSGGVVVPLLLIGIGILLLTRSTRPRQPQQSFVAPTTSTGAHPPPTTERAPIGVPVVSAGSYPPPAPGSAQHAGGGSGSIAAPPTSSMPPLLPPPGPPPEPSTITPLTLSLITLLIGGAALVDSLDLGSVRWPLVFAGTLALVGAGLVLSAWLGRARGLILVGLLLLPVLTLSGIASATSFPGLPANPFTDGIGERRHRPTSLAELEPEYIHGVGELHVDLSEVQLDEGVTTVDIRLGIGELVLVLPDDADFELRASVRIGDVNQPASVFAGPGDTRRFDRRGARSDLDLTVDEGRPGTLVIDAEVGIGDLQVSIR